MDNIREKAMKMNEEIKKEIDLSKLEETIKDNKIYFDYKDKNYRVRLLNLAEKEDLLKFQAKKEMEMLQEGVFKYERVLIPLLKKSGIDIEEINKMIEDLYKEEEKLMLKLGEAEKNNEPESVLKTYHDNIEKIQRKEIPELVIEKSIRLANSIESQLLDYTIKYMAYLSLEIEIEKEYTKPYKNYEEFLISIEESLLKKIVASTSLLQYIAE